MSHISIKIMSKTRKTLAVQHGENEVNLVYAQDYNEGDCIVVEIEEPFQLYWMQLDDGRGKSLVYMTGNVYYEIPFGEKRINMSPKTFYGARHLLSVKKQKALKQTIIGTWQLMYGTGMEMSTAIPTLLPTWKREEKQFLPQ